MHVAIEGAFMNYKGFFAALTLLSGTWVFAEEVPSSSNPWSHESEASVVQTSGNVQAETFSAKQKTTYKWDLNALTVSGRYLEAKNGNTAIAKQWGASGRYERTLSKNWSAFGQHTAESDYFAGFVQRDTTDAGAKVVLKKNDTEALSTEFGFAYIENTTFPNLETKFSPAARFRFDYSRKLNETVTAALWAEYIPTFGDDKNSSGERNYFINYEPSLNVMMNKVLSLKVSYLVRFQYVTPQPRQQDNTFTTALVAKF